MIETARFVHIGQAEVEHLTKKDKKLGEAIARIGPLERARTSDLFEAMVGNIIAQQISGKAAQTILGRLAERVGELVPFSILGMTVEDIQSCGMSMRKAGYIHSIAGAAHAGVLDGLQAMTDEEVTARLVALPGIGIWSAEMLLIFSLGRPDVVSFGDLGIRRGMQRLYGLKKEPTKAQFERYRKRYRPYGTVASLYLWYLAGEAK